MIDSRRIISSICSHTYIQTHINTYTQNVHVYNNEYGKKIFSILTDLENILLFHQST
jgi:hypothetical protein